MERIFFCGNCRKFFYADCDEAVYSYKCSHCESDMTITCYLDKETYNKHDDDWKNKFKKSIRSRYLNAEELAEEQHRCELKAQAQARLEIEKTMLLTTGYNFEGYKIIKYCDVIFEELIVGMGWFKSLAVSVDNFGAALGGSEASVMSNKLKEVKNHLRNRVKHIAVQKGANALIGIDFESSAVGELMMVSMTATAVVIEPEANNL